MALQGLASPVEDLLLTALVNEQQVQKSLLSCSVSFPGEISGPALSFLSTVILESSLVKEEQINSQLHNFVFALPL